MKASDEAHERCAYYPIYLNLRDKPVLVVGGGAVAARKIVSLVDAGARVRVVAPHVVSSIESLSESGLIDLECREWCSGDGDDVFLIYAATDFPDVNEAVFTEAEACGALVNVVDDPKHCNFIVPSVVKRGSFQVAVSTGGASPTLAKRVRHELEERYPEVLSVYVELLGEVRSLIKQRVVGGEDKRMPLYEASCDPALLERLRAGENLDAETVYEEIIQTCAPVGYANERGA